MSLEKLSDDSVLIFYESIRKEVAADLGVPQRVLGKAAKDRAEQLREEITRR